jgi:hypothetical protein
VKKNGARLAFIDHREVLEECSAYQGLMQLSSSSQIDRTECAVEGEFERGNMNVREMNIDLMRSIRSAHRFTINDRKLKRHG